MDIRKEYLEFFKSKGHEVISSMPLVPDDPTLMFTNAGMVQFKDIFTGNIPAPENKRAISLYEKNGFQKEILLKDEYGEGENRYLMAKKL